MRPGPLKFPSGPRSTPDLLYTVIRFGMAEGPKTTHFVVHVTAAKPKMLSSADNGGLSFASSTPFLHVTALYPWP
jgi:hypothetical protein